MNNRIINLNIDRLVLESDQAMTESDLHNSLSQSLQTYLQRPGTDNRLSQLENHTKLPNVVLNMNSPIDAPAVGQQFTQFFSNSFNK